MHAYSSSALTLIDQITVVKLNLTISTYIDLYVNTLCRPLPVNQVFYELIIAEYTAPICMELFS